MANRKLTLDRNRRGLTLVEMMVSVALTLMVVFALVQVFELLGENVADGRATIEMSGNLRGAAQLLREDLEGLTVTTLPPRSPDQGEGYLEIVDGPSTDSQHIVQLQNNGVPGQIQMVSLADQSQGFADVNGDGFLDAIAYDTSVGDVDDVLAFTTRRPQQPFTGVISDPRIKLNGFSLLPNPLAPTLILESTEVEVVWWLQIERNIATTDLNALSNMNPAKQIANATSAVGSLGVSNTQARILVAQRYANFTAATFGTPVRSLHRRALLIRPDLDLRGVVLIGDDAVAEFISNNDISVRVIRQSSENPPVYHVEANTLGDLSVRIHRACRPFHDWEKSPSRYLLGRSRFHNQRSGELLDQNSLVLRHLAMKDMVLGVAGNPNPVIMLRKGKDVVLSDVLGFDIQIWDPQAVVRLAADGTAVSPSDPGYAQIDNVAGSRGAYVDLGFAISPKAVLLAQYHGFFGGNPLAKSGLPIVNGNATYCTWSSHYEHDGYDQDQIFLEDQGRNGIDDDNQYGVDDPGEAETVPPYPQPLRGLMVKMRIMDFNTRQVRQTSVVTDFLPE